VREGPQVIQNYPRTRHIARERSEFDIVDRKSYRPISHLPVLLKLINQAAGRQTVQIDYLNACKPPPAPFAVRKHDGPLEESHVL
jgi:hypothetical protein